MAANDWLSPFEPTTDDPFERARAAHLGRRAGFGFSPAEVEECVRLGPAASVQRLLEPPADAQRRFAELLAQVDGELLDLSKEDDLQAWWIYRMLKSPDPLREKLTLFWHGHFATSIRKVELAARMQRQNETLRERALGRFRDLLRAISRDVAMVVWLDSRSNRKGKPNENYARELMELFTLGVGNYSEQDIREVARAFTGWHLRGEQFFFDDRQHDDGEKTVLGEKGTWNGDDVIDILLRQPACARFLAGKLLRFFVGPRCPAAAEAELAARLRATDYDVGDAVGTLLRSRLFFDRSVLRQRIKSPVEFVLGIVKSLGLRADCRGLGRACREVGQVLFAPPTVKGWDGERTWISAQWLVQRCNLAMGATALRGVPAESRFEALQLLQARGITRQPAAIVLGLAGILLDGPPDAATRDRLLYYCAHNDRGQKVNWNEKDDGLVDNKTRGVAHLLMTLPEYQLA
jgi:uncharacterized protein (DUF1800 family)